MMDAKTVEKTRTKRDTGIPSYGNGGTSELKIALTYLHSVYANVTSERKRKITIDCLTRELREDLGIAVDTKNLFELFEEAEKLGLVRITGKVVKGRDYRRYCLTAKGEDMVAPGAGNFAGFINLGKQPNRISHHYSNNYQR